MSRNINTRSINLIVIHCAATPNGKSLFQGHADSPNFKEPVDVIDSWHTARGFYRAPEWRKRFNPRLQAIGYHFVIYTDGTIASGRHPDEVGAHVAGYNSHSIGVCLIGTDHFTALQWKAVKNCITALKKIYPAARIVGHRDLSPDRNGDGRITPDEWTKTCPGFNVSDWLANGMQPLSKNLLEPTT